MLQVSFFSFVMSLFFFNMFIIIINFLRKKEFFIIYFSVYSLLIMSLLTIIRLLLPFEFKYAYLYESDFFYATIFKFLHKEIILFKFNVKLLTLFIFIWCLGIVVLFLKYCLNYFLLKKTISRLSIKKQLSESDIVYNILCKYKLNNKIQIMTTDKIYSPMLVGLKYATIYLPNINFTDTELECIVLHEINHYLGKDSFKKIIVLIIWTKNSLMQET